MMVMAAALAKLIFASVLMASKFPWRATTLQSDDWFQMQGTVKRSHLMAMNRPKSREGLGIIRTVRGEGRQRTPANSLWHQKTPNKRDFLGRHVTRTDGHKRIAKPRVNCPRNP